jgi:hypothetical protein
VAKSLLFNTFITRLFGATASLLEHLAVISGLKAGRAIPARMYLRDKCIATKQQKNSRSNKTDISLSN